MEGRTKAKLLYILERLKKTDEQHPVNTGDLIEYLQKNGITAERKSVARDIAALREAGFSVILCDELKKGYYMTDQLFEDYELKIIADAVSGAKFITFDDSKGLIEKLCELSSPTGEEIIREQTFIDEKIKTQNKKVRFNIDKVMTAIKNQKRITFQYFEFASDGKMKLKREGHTYEISPYYVCWTDEGYFLIGNSKSHDHLIHFHIDMMTNVEITRIPIRPRSEIEELKGNFSIGEYLRRSVNMYGGESIELTLECSGKVAKTVRTEFGENIKTIPIGEEKFRTEIKAAEGEGLIRWLMQFSPEDMKVISPQSIKDEIKERAGALAKLYE
ncbi:MAG: WYL domain-containing protein [Oscillospiraceae bacterium]|nr:WYL domain-containing protein [Oscillospiraceae bacterium]MBR3952919.1 WYL domain-containing protein [Oscillospiraceae bacterium]